ncbi:MAG TPA: hypothetical protein VGR32_03385 [Brevundimonas sp.]|jgi:hypothetical protein|uniref:hypothetical protein n=1 Tax=Brevundimonas sp. TaxID=1871086 RepID=UPI002DF3F416|nr:hypothetical protein [Brevundimonas sp.]
MPPLARAALILTVCATACGVADGALAQSRSPDAENRRVRVHNQTGVAVRALSVSEPGGGFGPDLLAGEALEPGRSRPLTIDAGSGACQFTIRAVLANGQSLERPGVNVCRIADWYLTR